MDPALRMRRCSFSCTVNPGNTDTEGDIESVRIKRVEFRENVSAFFPQGQSKLSVIMCLY